MPIDHTLSGREISVSASQPRTARKICRDFIGDHGDYAPAQDGERDQKERGQQNERDRTQPERGARQAQNDESAESDERKDQHCQPEQAAHGGITVYGSLLHVHRQRHFLGNKRRCKQAAEARQIDGI